MDGAAHQNHVPNRIGKDSRVSLRDIGYPSRDPVTVESRYIRSVEKYSTALPGKEAKESLEQCGLAATIGAQKTENFAGLDFKIDPVSDRKPRIAER